MAAPSATLPLARITSQMIKQTALGTTADNNITGANSTIYVIDATNNHATATGFLKIFDSAAPTVGTAHPEIVIPIAGAQRQIVTIAEGITSTTGISWAFTDAGGTGGTGGIPGGALVVAVVKAGT